MSAVPQFINFQGQLLDSTGSPVTDGGHLLKFIIWNDPSATDAANMKWNSNFQVINVSDGLFEYQLGSSVPLPDGLFSNDTILFLGVTEGANPEMLPRTKLVSVGYAFHALRADTADFAISAGFASVAAFANDADVALFAEQATSADIANSVVDDAVTSASIADGSIGSIDIDTTQIQVRVVGEAATGQAIRAINSDGSISTVAVGEGDITGVTAGMGLTGGGTSGEVDLSVAGGGITTVHIADGTIVNADINNGAAIDVSKISGTAVNLSSSQTITGQKQFGDSTLTVNNTGIGIGSIGLPISNVLLRLGRNYNTTGVRYGYLGLLDNQGTGIISGIFSSVRSNTSGFRGAFEGHAGIGSNTSGQTYGCFLSALGGAGTTVYGLYAQVEGASTNKYAGWFSGNVHVQGTLSKALGAFKIDHPLDPANKYLVHSFVESPDMMNVYNGNITLDGNGTANVTLPDYFDALNKDYRYQLTSIGAPGPNLYIASEISGNRFVISGGEPNSKVSWQVTGVRKDAYAEAHRINVEPDKPIAEKGLYLHPIELGLSETKQLHYKINKARLIERERIGSESTQGQ